MVVSPLILFSFMQSEKSIDLERMKMNSSDKVWMTSDRSKYGTNTNCESGKQGSLSENDEQNSEHLFQSKSTSSSTVLKIKLS